MNKYTTVFNWKNKYCENEYTAQSRFNAIPIKLPVAFFQGLEQQKKKKRFVWKNKRPQIAKAIVRKKNRTEDIMLLDLNLYCKATIIKTA